MQEVFATVETLAGGAVLELGNAELEKILQNIGDPNTDPQATRTLSISIKIKPDAERKLGAVSIEVTKKVAPHRPAGTAIHFGKVAGRIVAVDTDPNQRGMFDSEERDKTLASVTPIINR